MIINYSVNAAVLSWTYALKFVLELNNENNHLLLDGCFEVLFSLVTYIYTYMNHSSWTEIS